MLCDVDLFKQVNDTYGHDAGDIVLTEIANILRSSLRASDLVFRYGGEEFLVLLMDAKKDTAVMIAEKIRANVASTQFHLGESNIHKTISIGVSEFPDKQADNIPDAIKQADIALYKAKGSGRDKVIKFDHGMWDKDD